RSCSARSSAGSSAALLSLGPLEIGVRDRVAVRIVRRVAEHPVDPAFELLGQRELEAIGLVVNVVDVQAERLREVELEQAVVSDHLERDTLARVGQLDAAVALV